MAKVWCLLEGPAPRKLQNAQVRLVLGSPGPLSFSCSASPTSLKAGTAPARLDCVAHSSQTTLRLQGSRKPDGHAFPIQYDPAAVLPAAGGHVGIWLRERQGWSLLSPEFPSPAAMAMAENEGQDWAPPQGN